jgi:hypothetical protein
MLCHGVWCAVCLQASVPRETKLVITVQRASNLPRRLAAGGAGVRAVSPSRMTGEQALGARQQDCTHASMC